MNVDKWLNENTRSLKGKSIAITGATGGLGREICKYLLSLEAKIILVDRNPVKQADLVSQLKLIYPHAAVDCLQCDLEDVGSAIKTARTLDRLGIDVFIQNAGAYSIPRHKCETGYDNVFVINFLSSYCMIRELLPGLDKRGGRVVVVGSIAHNYSKTDLQDIDFSTRKRASLVYGNAKRFLMFSLYPLFKGKKSSLAVTHPGITLTGITSHYPKFIFALIKHPMKVIFMPPRIAALSVIKGIFENTNNNEWIGPAIFNVWGKPKKKLLTTCKENEAKMIQETAEALYLKISSSTT